MFQPGISTQNKWRVSTLLKDIMVIYIWAIGVLFDASADIISVKTLIVFAQQEYLKYEL